MSERPVGRPVAADVDATRAAILTAARERFAAAGYAATSNRDVAAAAGVTHGTVYHYYRTKRILFAAVVNEAYDVILPRLASIVLPDSFPDRVAVIAGRLAELQATDGERLRFLAVVPLEQARNPELLRIMGPSALSTYEVVKGFVDAGIATGDLAADLDPEATALMLSGCVLGITLYSGVLDDVSFGDMLGAFARLVAGNHLAPPPLSSANSNTKGTP